MVSNINHQTTTVKIGYQIINCLSRGHLLEDWTPAFWSISQRVEEFYVFTNWHQISKIVYSMKMFVLLKTKVGVRFRLLELTYLIVDVWGVSQKSYFLSCSFTSPIVAGMLPFFRAFWWKRKYWYQVPRPFGWDQSVVSSLLILAGRRRSVLGIPTLL